MASATDTDHWRRLENLFYQALDLDACPRFSFRKHGSGDNASLRKEIDSLLKPSAKTLSFLQEPVEQAVRLLTSESLGQRVGPYQPIGLLGEGGMGKVYLATRADHLYEQEVAIKLMHTGT